MKRYGFSEGVDAVMRAGHNNGWWFFKNVYDDSTNGVYAVKTNEAGTVVEWGPDLFTAPGGWGCKDPSLSLSQTKFKTRIDAAYKHPSEEEFWFFSGGEAVKVDSQNQILKGPKPVEEEWPALKNHVCNEPDAVFLGGSNKSTWFFKNLNNKLTVANTSYDGDKLYHGGELEESTWNVRRSGGLSFIDSRFVENIDAAVKNSHEEYWWVFSGQFAAKVDKDSQIVMGPMAIDAVGAWPALHDC